MKLERLADLFEFTKALEKRTLIAVNAMDSHSLEAISEAVELEIVSAILTGNEQKIRQQCKIANINPENFQIIHAETE